MAENESLDLQPGDSAQPRIKFGKIDLFNFKLF